MTKKLYRITNDYQPGIGLMDLEELTWENMPIHRHKSKVQRRVGDTRIGFKYSKYPQEARDDEQRLITHTDAETTNITCQVQPKHSKEELPERIEHFNKEIPPEPHIRRQIGQEKMNAVGRQKKLPGSAREEIGNVQEPCYACRE